MENEMESLKSCPFCGEKPSYDEAYNVVTCCSAVSPMSLKRWQTRPPQEQASECNCHIDHTDGKVDYCDKHQPAPSVDWEKEFDKQTKQWAREPREWVKDFIRQLLRGEKV